MKKYECERCGGRVRILRRYDKGWKEASGICTKCGSRNLFVRYKKWRH